MFDVLENSRYPERVLWCKLDTLTAIHCLTQFIFLLSVRAVCWKSKNTNYRKSSTEVKLITSSSAKLKQVGYENASQKCLGGTTEYPILMHDYITAWIGWVHINTITGNADPIRRKHNSVRWLLKNDTINILLMWTQAKLSLIL